MKKIVYVIILLALALALPSCAEDGSMSSDYYTFSDSLGNTVSLEKRPERVAVLFSSYADIWVTAGGTVDITVADTVERGFASSDVTLVDGGAGHTSIDTEVLIAAKPDLVIATADYAVQSETCELMRSLGVPSALFRVESCEDYLSVLKIFTDILATPERYEQYGASVAERIAEIKASASGSTFDGNMLFVRAGSTARSVKAKRAEDHFACAMIEELGFENIADGADELLDGLSLETVVSRDPCYIFVTFMGDEAAARAYMDTLLSSDGWSSLSAVKEGRVIYLPKSYFHYKPNSRWAEAYQYIYDEIVRTEAS